MTTYTQRTDAYIASVLGENAWRVGGSVRDELLGRRAKDADYVVQNTPLPNVMRLFSRAGAGVDILKSRSGDTLGVRVLRRGERAVEVVLPRTETKALVEDGNNERHNFEVTLDPKLPLSADALRRDFTFNAIYQNAVTGERVDPLNGQVDLGVGVVKTTHRDSFRDDPLRTLRALRFVSVLGFQLDQTTLDEMTVHATAVTGLTGKGVSGTALDELCKLLMGDNVADALRYARDTGVLAVLLPEVADMIGHDPQNSHHDYTTDEHTFVAIDAAARMGCSLRVRMSLLFHDAGKPEVEWVGDDGMKHYYESPDVEGSEDHQVASARRAERALRRLNAEKSLIRDVTTLNLRHMVPISGRVKPAKVRKWRCELGDSLLADLFKHRLADVMGKGTVSYEAISAIARLEQIREDAESRGVPASAKDMKDAGLIDGRDLIDMGIEPGKIGKVLDALLHEVVSQPERADRDWMLGRAGKLAVKL